MLRGNNYTFSDEATLECTSGYPGNRQNTCDGGYISDVLYYLNGMGSPLEEDYPYVAGNYEGSLYPETPGICNESSRVNLGNGTVEWYYSMTSYSSDELRKLLYEKGPIVVGLYASSYFSFYSSGVYTSCSSYSKYFLNHAVLLVGWDSDGNWIIKN